MFVAAGTCLPGCFLKPIGSIDIQTQRQQVDIRRTLLFLTRKIGYKLEREKEMVMTKKRKPREMRVVLIRDARYFLLYAVYSNFLIFC